MYTIRVEAFFINVNCKNCNKNFDRNCTVLNVTYHDQNGMKKASIQNDGELRKNWSTVRLWGCLQCSAGED